MLAVTAVTALQRAKHIAGSLHVTLGCQLVDCITGERKPCEEVHLFSEYLNKHLRMPQIGIIDALAHRSAILVAKDGLGELKLTVTVQLAVCVRRR